MTPRWMHPLPVVALAFAGYLAVDWLLYRAGWWHRPDVRTVCFGLAFAALLGARRRTRA